MDENELHSKLYPEAHHKPEYIICAAMHYDDGVEYKHQPKNIKTGIVVCGRRHHNAIYTLVQLLPTESAKKWTSKKEGFLTSKDNFVDRKEAGLIAFTAAQSKLTECLFSEDLY